MLTRVTSEFQITSCQCNKDKKIVHNAAMSQNAGVLSDFFSCDSFVTLYELFELFLDEGKLSAIDFIEYQTTLTPTRIYQRCLFDDSPTPLLFGFLSIDDTFILKRCDDSRNGPSRYSHPVTDVRYGYARIGKKDTEQSKLIVRQIIVF